MRLDRKTSVDKLANGTGWSHMILEAALCRAIDAGRATQIRRVIVASEPRYRRRKDRHGRAKRGQSVELVKPLVPKAGDRFPIKAASDKPVMCRVVVRSLSTERHGAISFADVRASGYRTTVEYKAAWVRRHDAGWIEGKEVTTGAGGVEDVNRFLTDELLAVRFDERWAGRDVYVLHVEVDRTGERYLAADPAAMETDYVRSPVRALAGEPAAVDEQTLAAFTKAAREKPKVTQMEVWAERRASLESEIERMERELGEAGDVGRNLGTSIRALRRQLDIVEGKLRRSAA